MINLDEMDGEKLNKISNLNSPVCDPCNLKHDAKTVGYSSSLAEPQSGAVRFSDVGTYEFLTEDGRWVPVEDW